MIKTIKMALEITEDIQNVLQYDKIKNCSNDLSKRPNVTEYLTYFNCGHVTIDEENNKQTTREFTLIAEENHTIPISNQGHEFKAWTYNGTVPGPNHENDRRRFG